MCNRKFGFFYIFCIFFISTDFLSIYLLFLHFSAERNFFYFLCRIYIKRKKAQRDLWRLSEVMPFGCHEALSSRLQIRGKDVSFSSIFSYNNK